MAASPAKRSPCPIACSLDLLGDRWTLLVVRDLVLGKSRYDEFLSSPEGIATNVLAERLRRLTQLGIVERVPSPTHRLRATYRLTGRGEALRPVMAALRDWGLAHVAGTSVERARALDGAALGNPRAATKPSRASGIQPAHSKGARK